MRDTRYWQQGNPERAAYVAWVTQGWRTLLESPADQVRDGVVQVQAYERRGPDGNIVQVQAHQRGAPPARAWEAQPNPEWRAGIARNETNRSSGDFGYGMIAPPPDTPLGRYQINKATLREAGWKDASGNWTPRAQRAGVRSDAQFLANPAAQEAAFTDVLRSDESQLQYYGILQRAGTTITRMDGSPMPLTVGGLVAAAHREGIGTVRRYMAERDANRPAPAPLEGRRGDLSRFNQIEARLLEFATIPYRRVGR